MANFASAMMGLQQQQQQQQQQGEPPFSLTALINHDNAGDIVAGSEEIRAALLPLLPEGLQTEEELAATLRSPQLRQALGSLSGALQSDNYNSVLGNFGLDPAAGSEHMMRGDSISAFLEAVQARNPAPAPAADGDADVPDDVEDAPASS